ncbi:uncharacterized protein DUF2125 [Stella humosa]|uniref:Uncharacterized protein DUF2125 n=1 Tax=Stella humosa TaxID=94 RepID=A0A3N1LJ57_9PROT|nr:DUF2125 domain-containing protein [Stella humosa]ROP91340.1 uncharacterized protein DUF2125 [Stella humosa]BBK34303.1 hypothetical protein STHU_49370 [Stella humosa]
MVRTFRTATLAVLLALLVLAGAGYAWFWHRVAADIAAGVPAWAASLAADGVRVRHGPVAVTGFPLVFRLEVPQPVFDRAAAMPAMRWSGDRLTLTAQPWALREWTIDVPQPSRLELSAGGSPWTAAVARVDGRLRVDAAAGELVIGAHGIAGSGDDPLAIAAVRLRLAGDPQRRGALAVALTADAIRLPARPQPLLGRDISRLAVDGWLVERIPNLPPAAALEAWRNAGGTVDVERFALAWGDVQADGAMTLALDPALQPLLAGTASLTGHEAVLDALVAAGTLRRMEAFGMRALLGAMAAPTGDGQRPALRVQFSIQDRRVQAGPVGGTTYRLLSLPRIEWPDR